MITKFVNFVKKNKDDIMLIIGVILISLLSFSLGYLSAKHEEKEPIIFEESSYE